MKLQSDYSLEIVTVDLDDGPVHFLSMWWKTEGTLLERDGTTPIWTCDTAYPSILDSYKAAARWAMTSAPDELCAVIQLQD